VTFYVTNLNDGKTRANFRFSTIRSHLFKAEKMKLSYPQKLNNNTKHSWRGWSQVYVTLF